MTTPNPKPRQPRVPKSRPILHPHGPPEYICSGCGARFTWGPDSGWFGSWKEYEGGDPVAFACGDACRLKLADLLGVDPEPLDDIPADQSRRDNALTSKQSSGNFLPSP